MVNQAIQTMERKPKQWSRIDKEGSIAWELQSEVIYFLRVHHATDFTLHIVLWSIVSIKNIDFCSFKLNFPSLTISSAKIPYSLPFLQSIQSTAFNFFLKTDSTPFFSYAKNKKHNRCKLYLLKVCFGVKISEVYHKTAAVFVPFRCCCMRIIDTENLQMPLVSVHC